jgi:hypothetical protein
LAKQYEKIPSIFQKTLLLTLNKGCRLAGCFREISQFFYQDAKSRPPDDGRATEFNLQHIEKAKRGKIPAWPWNLNAFLLKV